MTKRTITYVEAFNAIENHLKENTPETFKDNYAFKLGLIEAMLASILCDVTNTSEVLRQIKINQE